MARLAKHEEQLTIDHVPIGDLRPDSFNPRRISDAELEALTRSIREFGLVDPIIARREDRAVIGGHQRLVAARRLGLDTVPVVFVDLFLGSGSTVIAAERTGRICFGMELDPHYCRIVIARWEAFTGLKAEKLSK